MGTSSIRLHRGALLMATSGKTEGDVYMLVRETDQAQYTNPVGEATGSKFCVFNLVNISTSGKMRVSTPERKMFWSSNDVPLSAICKHYGIDFVYLLQVDAVQDDITALIKRKAGVFSAPVDIPAFPTFPPYSNPITSDSAALLDILASLVKAIR